jgi:HAE1 family hydrophobic/amphiphilic exporter-1
VTFGSLLHPFTILFSLPFALSGALVGLALTGRPISISSLIGMMMLIGIVTTNAIVLVDLVQQYRARGMDAREALIRAGRTRVRPIIMTAVATVIALVPLAIGLTEGALIASELATTVIGGLITSTLLTLIVVPVIYSLLDGLSSRGREPVAAPPDGGGPTGWEEAADRVDDPAAVGAGVVAAEAAGSAAAARSETSSIKLPETDAVALTLGETTGTPVPPPGVPRLLDTGEVPVVSG